MASRIIERANEAGDFVTGDDGYVVFWPTLNKGAFSADVLRELADELDRRNEPWDRQMAEYFTNEALKSNSLDTPHS